MKLRMDLVKMPMEDSTSPVKGKEVKEDGEFTPSVEMMVHDYDDEQTLEEEEALGPLEDPQVELNSLHKEGDMPLEDLMAMYGYNGIETSEESSEEAEERSETESNEKPEPSELEKFYSDDTRNVKLRLSEDEEDFEYYPEEEVKKKTIMVGSEYQARIPNRLTYDVLPYLGVDELVWDPSVLLLKDIESYLLKVQKNNNDLETKGKSQTDEEHALYLLLKCNFNVDEAVRKIITSEVPGAVDLNEEERKHFESGLDEFGKRFDLIQRNHVKTRSVQELVEFYYWWKRSGRYEEFLKARLEQPKVD